MTNTELIHKQIIQLRQAVGGLEARRVNGVMFAVKNAKELMSKLRDALDALGMYCYVVQQDVTNIEAAPNPKTGKTGTLCLTRSVVRLVASDGSYIDMVGSGHGADADDKAAGKASTYAWKDAIIKGLCLPDAEMEKVLVGTVDTDDSSGSSEVVQPKRRGAVGAYGDLFGRLNAATNQAELDSILAEAREGHKTTKIPPTVAQEIIAIQKAKEASFR